MQSNSAFQFAACKQPCCSAQNCAQIDDDDDDYDDDGGGAAAECTKRHAAAGTWLTPERAPPPQPCMGEGASGVALPPTLGGVAGGA